MYAEFDGFSVRKIFNGGLQNNSYIVKSGDKCVVIDPASKMVATEVAAENLSVLAVLLTHGHFDHIKGVQPFLDKGVPIYIHRSDNPKCTGEDMPEWLDRFRIQPFCCTHLLQGGEKLAFDDLEFEVIHTPGHSAGGVCYRIKNVIFSGDTLFYGSYGRYDFADSSFNDLKCSILDKLFAIDCDCIVYPGHGDSTTLKNEKGGNMILWS